MDNNCCFVSRMCSAIGLIELTVEIDQFAIYMMKIATLNQNTLHHHHQFAKEFLAIMETDSTQKAVVHNVFAGKVEMILKGSLDSIPSPSVKIQIMGGKVCLRCKVTLLGVFNKLLVFKSLFTKPNNVLHLHLKQTFNLNFH